jgi:hypothetical protein
VGEDFTIGEYFDYEGKMDDFRIYNIAKSESGIEEIYRGGDLASAWGPTPYDGQPDAPRDANLAWNAGDYADSHDVYFGTDYAAVRDANTAVTLGVFRGDTTDESNDIEILDLDTYYYWRIDEVNDSNGFKWKGDVWKFKVADHIVVDDFESYEGEYDIRAVWVDGFMYWWYENGSLVVMGKYSASNPKYIPHSGEQIMRYRYNNGVAPLYSEAYLPLDKVGGTNWEEEGVKALTLFFYGLRTNYVSQQDQLYVAIEDTGGTYAEIRYGDYERMAEEDINDINEPEWHQWFIGLPDFNDPCYAAVPNDVTLTDVNRLYIGFGNKRNPQLGNDGYVHFDDIRLNRSICRPEFVKPVADFTGPRGVPDCVVDLADIGYVADEWLKSDANFADIMEEPCDANIVGHWKLDQDPCDSSSYNHYGYIDGTAYSWVTGHDGEVSNPALEFTGGGTRVLVDDSNDLKPKYAVTASAWVYYTESQSSSRVVVKGADNAETYNLEVDGLDDFVFQVRDVNGNKFEVGENGSFVWPNEWIHIAGTFDGDTNTVKSYVNGELKGSRADANFVKLGKTLSQDTAGLAIGNRSDDTNRQFMGAVDEVRIYDYALSEAQIKWLATDGTGYIPLRSEANLYDLEPQGERAVNFRDIALLISEHWLEEKKWP